MNTLRNIFFALFVLTVTITGCKKDIETTQNESENTDIQLKNGYLVFKDSATFNDHINWIRQNETNPEIIYQFNKNLGFESFSEVYDKGMRITDPVEFDNYRTKNPDCFKKIILEDNSEFWEMPMSSLKSYLSDKHGVYKIKSTLFRLTEKAVFSTKDEAKFTVLINSLLASTDTKIKCEVNPQLSTLKDEQISYRTVYFPGWSDRRIVARLYHGWDGNNNYDARTTSQQKNWTGAWVYAKIPELIQSSKEGYYRMEWIGQLSTPISIPPTYDRKLDHDNFRRTLVDGAVLPISTPNSSCLVTHYGQRYGNIAQIIDNQLFAD